MSGFRGMLWQPFYLIGEKKPGDAFFFKSVSLLFAIDGGSWFLLNHIAEAAIKKCSYKKVFLKYAANLLENAHAASHFGMGVLL